MRVVLLNMGETEEPIHGPEPAYGHDILYITNNRARLCAEPQTASYAEIAAHYPPGWKPDVFLHWSLEYNPVPEGIEEADCLTAVSIGDWNLGGEAMQRMGGAFDMIFADRNGCARLKAAGFPNVYYVPLWGYDPPLHRRLPGIARDLDIVLAGSFNHEVQRERARWLARVARLSHRYRVCLTTGVYGEEYARLMNRAKIVFNRSIRGEINMRAYEAPACGALMFYERENPEIRDLFTDREECVLYGDDDLEDLLEYYLTHAEERERIVEAAYRKVQPETNGRHVGQVYEIIEREREAVLAGPGRAFREMSFPQRKLRYACQNLVHLSPVGLDNAEQMLAEAEQATPTNSTLANARACVLAESARCCLDDAECGNLLGRAMGYAQHALYLDASYVAARFNLAQMCLLASDPTAARILLAETWQLLQAEPFRAAALRGPYFPRHFVLFQVEREKISADFPPETPEWTTEMRRLLRWRVAEQLSDLAHRRGDYAEAEACAREAVALRPDLGVSHWRLARALRGQNVFGTEMEASYRHALDDMPFQTDLWIEYAEWLLQTEAFAMCRAFLQDTLALVDGCPPYYQWRPKLRALLSQIPLENAPRISSPSLRLLALPDWNRPEQWQSLLCDYVRAFAPGTPVVLLLPVAPERHPAPDSLSAQIERFLRDELHVTPDDIPDISLLTDPIPIAEIPDVLRQVDALALTGTPEEAAWAAQATISLSFPAISLRGRASRC